jgi:phosphoesterase RecJ-like protein
MAKKNDSFEEIKEVIDSAKNILVLTHKSPDGDAVGSALAMYQALIQLDKEADVMVINYSNLFKFLPSASKIKETSNKEYDLVITLDCSTKARVEESSNFFDQALHTINIDHHYSNEYFGEFNYVDKQGPATCQTLYKMFLDLGIIIDKKIGECLIAGIITDTGGFKYSTNSLTFDIASHLYKLGVNISKTYINTMQTKTKSQFALTNLATERLEFLKDGQIAFTYITLKDEKKVNAQTGDHEGIVDVGKSVEGVEVSIFLHEGEEGFKVSLRSNNKVDVGKVSINLGGGGHKKAAGCLLKMSVKEAKEVLLKEIEPLL